MTDDTPAPQSGPRIVSRDDLLELIEGLREDHPAREWPTIREIRAASRQKFTLGIGSDRARILLNEAQAAVSPPDDPSKVPSVFGAHALAVSARAARIRRRQARLLADGATPERADDVRQLLTECHTHTLREGPKAAAIIEILVARFDASDRRRMALLQDQPEPAPQSVPDIEPDSPQISPEIPTAGPHLEPDAKPDDKPDDKPAAPTLEPDAIPDTHTYRDDPRQIDIEDAIAAAASAKPDAEPDANTQLLDLLTP